MVVPKNLHPIDLAIAGFTLKSDDYKRTFTLAQGLDLAKELKGCLKNQPPQLEEFRKTLDVLDAVQKNNPYAKAILNKLGINNSTELKDFKQNLEKLFSGQPPDSKLTKLIDSLDTIAHEQQLALAADLKRQRPDAGFARQKDVTDKTEILAEQQNLKDLPRKELTQEALLRMQPAVDQFIRDRNEFAKKNNANAAEPIQAERLIDQEKIRQEWTRGEFGPESRRLWTEAQSCLENDVVGLVAKLKARGIALPTGCPIGPAASDSGSGLRETDEMFASRLAKGDVTLSLAFKNLKPGEVPSATEVDKFINTVAFTAQAGQKFYEAFTEGSATYVEQAMKDVAPMCKTGNLDAWRRPKDLTTDELNRWSLAALSYADTALKVRNYAETIGAFNVATTTEGKDWYQLQDLFKLKAGVDHKMLTFPDDALKDENFPGHVTRNADRSVASVQLELPKTLDRNNPEDVAKMEKLNRWIEKYGPDVDKVSLELMKMMSDPNHILVNMEDDGFERRLTVSKNSSAEFKEKNNLKGDQSDVGKPVKPAHAGEDWRVSHVNDDGSYELERVSPTKGADFNLKRYGFTASTSCDKDGKEDKNGEYIKVDGYKDYLHKNLLAYNNWNVAGAAISSVERQSTFSGVYHKNDFVTVLDNGRLRLMQVKNLEAWQASHENAELAGKIVNTAVDSGMLVSGTVEFKAGWMAAKEGGLACIRAGLKEGWWHLGLGATGFGKTAIEEHLPYGRELMQARHYAIMLDMSASLFPGAKASILNKTGSLFGTTEKLPGEISVVQKYLQQPFAAASNFDKALIATSKVMEGITPQIGVMPFADYYMIAQFSDFLNTTSDKGKDKERLINAVLDHRRPGSDQLPFYGSGDGTFAITSEQMKKAAQGVAENWSNKLISSQKETNAAAEQIEKAVKEASALQPTSEERSNVIQKLLDVYSGIDHTSTRAEKLAAARGLLELSKNADGKTPDVLGKVYIKSKHSSESVTTAQVSNLVSDKGETAQKLLKTMTDLMGTPANTPESIQANLQASQQALKVFEDKSAPDHDRVAAAILLLSQRSGDDLTQKLNNANPTTDKDVLNFLKDKAHTADSLNVQMVAGEMLLRSHRLSESSVQAQQAQLNELQAQSKLQPTDTVLTAKIADATAKLKLSQEFQNAIGYNNLDYAGLCMNVLRSEDASVALKLQAIASPVGPGLALIADQLKNEIEPALLRDPDAQRRIRSVGALYGRDSAAIERCLREAAADPKQNIDVRALAVQALSNGQLERNTVNGVPLTPGVELKVGSASPIQSSGTSVAPQHATMKVGADGKEFIRDLNSKDGTLILRDGKEIKVTATEWHEVKPGDRIFLGTQSDGRELLLSHERIEGLARMGALVKANADESEKNANANSHANTIAGEYLKNLQSKLLTPFVSAGKTEIEKQEQLVEKYRAAVAAMNVGASAFGLDASKHSQMVAAALADCVQAKNPEAAVASLQMLTSLVNSLTAPQADALRERILTSVINEPLNTDAKSKLREVIAETMPVIFAGGTDLQKRRAAGMLEAMVINGSNSVLRAQETSPKDRSKYIYPVYPADHPNLREAAIRSLGTMDGKRGAQAARLVLLGGKYNDKDLKPDVPSVRMAALEALEKSQSAEFHSTALQALRSETDPAVAAKLWNVEYGARRAEADPARLQLEYEALNERINSRARPGLAEDAAKADKNWERPDTPITTHLNHLWQATNSESNFASENSKQARLALIHLATTRSDAVGAEAALHLYRICQSRGKDVAAALSGPLEYALLSNLRADAQTRSTLVAAYMQLKPGENGVVSKSEAALVLSRVLENELSRMPRSAYAPTSEYVDSTALQTQILSQLRSLPTDSVIPAMAALTANDPVRQIDERLRPTTVKYGDITRNFEYDLYDQPLRMTEQPSGKVYERDNTHPENFVTGDGEQLRNLRFFPKPAVIENAYSSKWATFDKFLVNGDYGDISYEKGTGVDAKRYVLKSNGTTIEESFTPGIERHVKLTYPGGKLSQEVVITPGQKGADIQITTMPGGKSEKIKLDLQGGFSWYGSGGISVASGVRFDGARPESICPLQFDRGELVYKKDGHTQVFDAYGRHLDIDEKGKTIIEGAKVDSTVHPISAVRTMALQLLSRSRDSTEVPRQLAEAELRSIQSQAAGSETSSSRFGVGVSTSTIADAMSEPLSKADGEPKAVVKALHLGMLSKPIEGQDDPRLMVLRIAAKDKNETVRAEAARLLFDSPNALDKEQAAFIAADISKNAASGALKTEAKVLLEQFGKANSQLVQRALAETPDAQRAESDQVRADLSFINNPRAQRAFEDVRRRLMDGRQESLSWSDTDWNDFCTNANLPLLTNSGLSRAQAEAANVVDANRGRINNFLSSEALKESEREKARQAVLPQVLRQVDGLVEKAMKASDVDPQGRASRQALAYIIMTDGQAFNDEQKEEAVKKAVEGLSSICAGNSPGRGDTEWILRGLLTNKPDLKPEYRHLLLGGLDALTGDKNIISKESGTGIATLALEQEVRFMPRPEQNSYKESVAHQKALLDFLAKSGNRDLAPALAILFKNHPDKEVRDRAAAVLAILRSRVSSSIQK